MSLVLHLTVINIILYQTTFQTRAKMIHNSTVPVAETKLPKEAIFLLRQESNTERGNATPDKDTSRGRPLLISCVSPSHPISSSLRITNRTM